MKQLVLKVIFFYFFVCFTSCEIGIEHLSNGKYEYYRELALHLFEKDWYVVGLHCDHASTPGDYDIQPMLRFDSAGGEEHYLWNQQIYLQTETTGGINYFIDGNDVGEIEMSLFYHNIFGAEQVVQFKVMEITENKIVIFDDDSALFPSEEFCWITLEAR